MMHFTCDLCGKDLSAAGDPRFVVKLEVSAGHDPCELTDADFDDDQMEEVSRVLEEMEDSPDDAEEMSPPARNFRYDLCPTCHKKFLRDPLGKDAAQKFRFSKN